MKWILFRLKRVSIISKGFNSRLIVIEIYRADFVILTLLVLRARGKQIQTSIVTRKRLPNFILSLQMEAKLRVCIYRYKYLQWEVSEGSSDIPI